MTALRTTNRSHTWHRRLLARLSRALTTSPALATEREPRMNAENSLNRARYFHYLHAALSGGGRR